MKAPKSVKQVFRGMNAAQLEDYSVGYCLTEFPRLNTEDWNNSIEAAVFAQDGGYYYVLLRITKRRNRSSIRARLSEQFGEITEEWLNPNFVRVKKVKVERAKKDLVNFVDTYKEMRYIMDSSTAR